MALYRYEAVDRAGKVVRGAMNAGNEHAVAQSLAAKGYAPRSIHLASGANRPAPAPAAASTSRASSGASTTPVSVASVIPAARLALFFRQLATMVIAGMPISQALDETANLLRSKRLGRAVAEMQTAVVAGKSLSGAMAAHPAVFPVHAVSVVWCGELAGRLENALDDLARDFEREAEDTRWGRIGWGLTKISIVVLVLSLPFFNMGTLLAPFVAEVVQDGSAEMGLSVGAFLARALPGVLAQGLPIAVALVVIWIVWGHVKRVAVVRRILDSLLLRTPPWGKLHRCRALARFTRYMDMLYASGVNPSTSWDAASLTPRNSEIAEKLRAARSMATTSTVSEAARMANVLLPEDVALISGGEKAGDIPGAFSRLSEMYSLQSEVQRTVAKTLSISLLVSSQLILAGVVIIYMASSYRTALFKLMGD